MKHKYILASIFIMLLSASTVFAANGGPKYFIDDIVEDIINDAKDDLRPFQIIATDLLDNDRTITHQSRRIRLALLYKVDHKQKINAITESELEEIFNDNLLITYILPGQDLDDDEYFEQLMSFHLEFKNLKTTDDDFLKVTFVSDEVILDYPRILKFALYVNFFMDELGIRDSSISSTEEDKLNFKPIIVEADEIELDTFQGEDTGVFPAQSILATLTSDTQIDIAAAKELRFSAYRKGSQLEPYAVINKATNKKLRLSLAMPVGSDALVTQVSSSSYTVGFDCLIDLENQFQDYLLTRINKPVKVLIPFSLNTLSENGLELRVKGVVSTKLLPN